MALVKLELLPLPDLREIEECLWFKIKLDSKAKWRPDIWLDPARDEGLLRQRLDASDESAWTCAIDVFERRIRERYLSCLDVLMKADSRLDVSVSPPPPPDCSTLPDDQRQPDDDSVARSFVDGVRNGIFHEAETRGWLIWREEPPGQILDLADGRYALNRTEFYQALKAEFDGYVAGLRGPSNSELRSRFKKKMSDIVKES